MHKEKILEGNTPESCQWLFLGGIVGDNISTWCHFLVF